MKTYTADELVDVVKNIKRKSDIAKVEKMLDSGVDPNGRCYYENRTPLMLCIDYLQYAIENNPEIFTGKTDHIIKYYTEIIDILLDSKYTVDAGLTNKEGDTALILACRFELEDVANKLLARADSNPSARNKHGMNAFMWACNEMPDVASKILDVCPSIVEYYGSGRFISGEIEEKFNETKRMLENAK